MERSRILEKIQKALNLANDAGATPGEAAAALNSAQKLMAKFAVEETELGLVGMGTAKVQVSIQAGKKVPMSLTYLISLLRKACGVEAMVHTEVRISDPSWCVTYYGPQHRVEMAAYLHHVLTRSIEKGWALHLKANPHLKGERGAKTGYYAGWSEGVRAKLT